MKCKYCGKKVIKFTVHPLNNEVCSDCLEEINRFMADELYRSFIDSLKETGLGEAFGVLKKWLSDEFLVYRFQEFNIDSRQKYNVVLRFIAVKEMELVKIVRFPVIVDVRIVTFNKKPALKITMKDDTKSRDTIIFEQDEKTLAVYDKGIRYVKTDMGWCGKYLKDFLK